MRSGVVSVEKTQLFNWFFYIVGVNYSFFYQGPCIGNQQSLAHSRLWDAVVGFLHVFANMQMKLSQVIPHIHFNAFNWHSEFSHL